MKNISILVPEGNSSVVNIEGTFQIFSEVNSISHANGGPTLFEIQTVGLTKEVSQPNGMIALKPMALIGEVHQTDLIIIPAMYGEPNRLMEANKDFIPWIRQHYEEGTEVASLCIASFFLAATGLLDGKKCSTHWSAANHFRSLFPEINLVDDKILTEEDGIYTSGGAYSFLNLLLYLIEKYTGREMSVRIAKTFMIDLDRFSQSPFIIFEGQKNHEDEAIRNAQEFIENNYEEKISVDQLASRFALGRRNMERRFKKATANTVTEYIQRVKIEAAKKTLEAGRKNISEVMYEVGYSDTKSFRTIFKKITGLSPLEYRIKYSKEAGSFVA